MRIFNYKKINELEYLDNKPFPHIQLNNYWDDLLLKQCSRNIYEFDKWEGEKTNFFGAKEKKYSGNYKQFPESIKKVIDELYSSEFLDWLKTFTSEEELTTDPNLEGGGNLSAGGIHSVGAGGFLKIHADPNWNTKLKLYRRLNALVYLNENWQKEWGGDLELWTKDMGRCEKKISPIFNTTAIFTTNDSSYHGHPDPLKCPSGVRRNTIFVYYYSPIKPQKGYYYKRPDTKSAKYKQRSWGDFDRKNLIKRIIKKIWKWVN